MDFVLIVIILTVVAALAFDVINGFHDAANSIATIVSTRVLSPRAAVLWAAFFNFAAMFIFKPEVANTIKKIVHIDASDPGFVYVVLAALLGAIVWDLLTWLWGLPTSSSHALIGGLVGAGGRTQRLGCDRVDQGLGDGQIHPLGALDWAGLWIRVYGGHFLDFPALAAAHGGCGLS